VTEDWKDISYKKLNKVILLSQKQLGEVKQIENCCVLLSTSSLSGSSGFNVRCPDGGCCGILQFFQVSMEIVPDKYMNTAR